MKQTLWILLGLVLFAASCKQDDGETGSQSQQEDDAATLFRKVSSETSGIDFVNHFEENDSQNVTTYEYIYNGSGVGVADFNNDGLLDLYFSSNQGSSKLYMNRGDMKFEDVTEAMGVATTPWCTGVTLADVNNDGWMDIYVCKSTPFTSKEDRRNLLFINNQGKNFTESAEAYGIDNNGFSTSANFFDMEGDGDLDMFLGNHAEQVNHGLGEFNPRKKYDEFTTDRMYRNNGDGTFTDITASAGMESFAFCLSTALTDVNGDGYPDLYVSNDYFYPDFLYVNNGDGTFTEERDNYFKHMASSSMGSDAADINNDGRTDIVALDMLPEDNYRRKVLLGPANFDRYVTVWLTGYGHQVMKNVLQLSNGPEVPFSEVGNYAGIEATDWSWAPLLADFDNDGWKDLYVTNGYFRDVTDQDFMMHAANVRKTANRELTSAELAETLPSKRIANYAYRNNGDLTFENVSKSWGLDDKLISNGAAYADLDNDGDLEIITCNLNDPVTVYENLANEQNDNHYLQVQLKPYESNYSAIGAKVYLTIGESYQMVEHQLVRGYQSSSSPIIHFGLGSATSVDEVRVVWPSGKQTILSDVKADQQLVIDDEDASSPGENRYKMKPVFRDVADDLGIEFKHEESNYVDYKREPLIPHMYSKKGPGIAVGDVNGDGRDDFIVTAAAESTSELYLQTALGKFVVAPSQPWANSNRFEETGCLMFDADGDGDLDIYLAAGSNEIDDLNSPFYQDRLFTNDGTGNFSHAKKALPSMPTSTSVVTSADIDGDGDQDLLVGGSVVPGQYPISPRSYLLINNGGSFTDKTSEWCPPLQEAGLVSMAVFSDYDGDHKPDILLVGRWTPLRVFHNEGAKFKETTAELGLSDITGWWNSLLPVDVDNDGDLDYVAGNKGLNSQVRSSPQKPCRVYYGDFDDNNRLDAICTQYYGSVEAPVYAKAELEQQMSYYMNAKMKRHYEYAKMDIHSILPTGKKGLIGVLEAKELRSMVFLNEGNSFRPMPLPAVAQLSQLYGMTALDANNDGIQDLLIVGNSYDPKVEFGWDDALNGVVLHGDGNGGFIQWDNDGFHAPHNAMSFASIRVGDELHYLVGNNHEHMQAFGVTRDQKIYSAPAEASYAMIDVGENKNTKVELSTNAGYLSQSSRSIATSGTVKFYTADGKLIDAQ